VLILHETAHLLRFYLGGKKTKKYISPFIKENYDPNAKIPKGEIGEYLELVDVN
jgi:hypothetical protein